MLPEVERALCSAYTATPGNASTLYLEGRCARQALEGAREELAGVLGCAPQELYFCSGGTEAAGTLIEGIARGAQEQPDERRGRKQVICAAFEHHAVLESALSLKRQGFEVVLLRPNREGYLLPEDLAGVLSENTLLVTVMLAQNELGTVQDVASLASLAHQAGALFVSDCVQAFGKMPFSLDELAVDAACFSAHKLGGPFGVGAFYLRPGVSFLPRQLGGGQERRLRSGTQDVSGAQGFALAARLQTDELLTGERGRLALLRDSLLTQLGQGSDRIRPTILLPSGDAARQLPGFLPLLVRGIESQTMVLKLDELGFAVSGGAACSSASLEPSHVLTSLGIPKDDAYGALRVTLGRGSTAEDCERFGETLLSLL
jgi:cysteine desulfurase